MAATIGFLALILGILIIHTPMIELITRQEISGETQPTYEEPAREHSAGEVIQLPYNEVSVVQGQLRLTMKVHPITSGQPLVVTLELTNVGDDPICVTATSAQIFDFIVYKDGVRIYQWSSDKVFAQVIVREILQPDESIIQTLSSEPITFTEGSYATVGMAKVMYCIPYERPLPGPDREKAFPFIQTPPLRFEINSN